MKTSFQMSHKEDKINSAGGVGLKDLVFDQENHEPRFWKLCKSRVPRSEVQYFTQFVSVLFLIGISLIKVFFHPDFKESTICFSLFSCTVIES